MDFDKPGLEKPWLENKECIEDYFNYGKYAKLLVIN